MAGEIYYAMRYAHDDLPYIDLCYDVAEAQIENKNLPQEIKKAYALIATPQNAITVDRLPTHIQALLADHFIDAVFGEDKIVRVKHAY